ncbi:DNA-protecting protein DprA [Allopusillimonas ginsengisoli]|nr:DNA-protecting protein DprA [Allopusillimonas ginsengisoli]
MPVHLPIEELRAWIRLSLEPGLGPVQARQLLATAGLPHDVYDQSAAALSKAVPEAMARQLTHSPDARTVASIDATLAWLAQPRHHVLTLADPTYPASLLDTHDPPLLLYVNGNPALLSRPAIAIVGARSASPAGQDNARAFSRFLAGAGWCIVSGLAEGIDAAAHEGALQAGPEGGATVAVLGTGIDIVYPARNLQLAHQIAEHGALVSEFPLGTRAIKHQFPRRNRLVAGMARGVLVVEAARQSGSLITARLAGELGREVFAIPGSIHSPLSRGCHALIRQGAKLVESGQDIQDELGQPGGNTLPRDRDVDHGKSGRQSRDHNADHSRPDRQPHLRATKARAAAPSEHAPASVPARVLEALGHDPVHVDLLVTRTEIALPELQAALLKLELSDAVARLPDGRYQRRQP